MRLGISGYARTGKDEVAKVFEEHGFHRIGMSDALNNYLCILNPILDITMDRDVMRYADAIKAFGYVDAKDKIPEVRRLLQVMGTEVGRAIDPDMWVTEMIKLSARYDNTVTTGIRFMNEHKAMDVRIHVTRTGYGPLNDHSSEDLTGIDKGCDWYIHNGGTLEGLREQTEIVYQRIMETRS